MEPEKREKKTPWTSPEDNLLREALSERERQLQLGQNYTWEMVATYMNGRNGGVPRTYTAINIRHRHQRLEEAMAPLAGGLAAGNHGENDHARMHQPIQPSQPSLPPRVPATQQHPPGFMPPPFGGLRLNLAPGTFGNSDAATASTNAAHHGEGRPRGLPARGREDGNGAGDDEEEEGPGDPFVARWLEENGY